LVVEPGNQMVVGLIARTWPDVRPRLEDGLYTFVTSTVAEPADAAA
jgi:hypothetical protein